MTFTTLTQKLAIATSAIAAASFAAAAPAQALSIGDIQITGYQSQNPDSFSFVTWADIAAGAGLTFTDNGFNGTAFRSTEGAGISWSNSTGGVIAAGTVINITTGLGADQGTGAATPAFANTGDQIFVIDGSGATVSATAPLLFGFNYTGTAGWSDTGANSNTSALPSVLNVSGGNLALGGASSTNTGVQYTGPRSGKTIAEYKALLSDIANWTPVTGTSTGGVSGGVTSTDFVVASAEPVPTPALLPALIGFGASIVRKRKQETV